MAKPSQPAVGEQFYVTHCATADSVLNNPGYTVRAASADDRDALESAFRYPPYELPIDMWRDLPPVERAPRRLARTLDAESRVWVAHSAHLAKDSVGRDRSYFSHLFLMPGAEPRAVLESWGAPDWATEHKPGAPKQLSAGALPEGELVGEAALTAFLSATPSGPTELSLCVCPERLRADPAARRAVLERALHAVLLRAEAPEARRRLYIHAEPGLVALALYAAVRLLPATVTQGLTFSTFEPYHRNIREYKLADVVGTYLGAANKGLDADLGTARGFVLDTFDLARSSPELRGPLPAGLGELLDLVEGNDWPLLKRVRDEVGAGAAGLPAAGAAVRRARLVAKLALDAAALEAGTFKKETEAATMDDLLALKAEALAAHDLGAHIDAVWEKVHRHLHRADVRAAFRDLISAPARVKELWLEAVDALLNENYRAWDARWPVVREAGGREEAARRLKKLVGDDNEDRLRKQPTDMRAKMRAACTDVGLFPTRGLLVPVGLGELEPLLAGPHDQAGYTAFMILAPDDFGWLNHLQPPVRERMRARAKQFLYSAPVPAFAAYVRGAREYLNTGSHFLDVLFKPHSEPAAGLLSRVLAADALEPSHWRKLCDSASLTQDAWGTFLLEKNHLSGLLVGLGGVGTGADVWQGYLDALTPALIEPGDEGQPSEETAWERTVHAQLKLAGEKLPAAGHKLAPALPDGGVAKLFAANNLVKWAADPASAERAGTVEVQHACQAFEMTPYDLARAVFLAGGYKQLELNEPTELPKLEPLLVLFRTAFPTDAAHNSRSAVTYWLRLSQELPKGKRAMFQSEFVLKCVPELFYRDLLAEVRQTPFEPIAVSRINQVVQGKVKPKAQKAGRPALPEPEFANEVTEGDAPSAGDGELPTGEDVEKTKKKSKGRATKTKGDYKQARRARRAGGNNWAYLIAGVLLIVVLVVGALIALRSGKPDPPPKKDPEPPPKVDTKKDDGKKDDTKPKGKSGK
jgi:hypothetical protein